MVAICTMAGQSSGVLAAPSALCERAADSTWSHGAASSAAAGSPAAASAASPPRPLSSHTTDAPRVRPLSTQSLLVTSPSAAGGRRAAGRPRHHGRGARHRQRGGRLPAAAVQVRRGEGVGGPPPRTLGCCFGFFLGGVGWIYVQPSGLHWRRASAAGLAGGSVAMRGRGRGRNGLCRARGKTSLRARPADRCRPSFLCPAGLAMASSLPPPSRPVSPAVALGRYYSHLTSDAVPLPTPPAPPAPGVTYTLFGVPQVVRIARRRPYGCPAFFSCSWARPTSGRRLFCLRTPPRACRVCRVRLRRAWRWLRVAAGSSPMGFLC